MREKPQIPVLAQEIDSPPRTLRAPAVVIVGPTASGKTDLALALARAVGGEILSADSRQIYRGLDAGTAKPKRDARGRVEGIAYHLIDCADPDQAFDAGDYAERALRAGAEIRERGLLPIIAGGTGLYVRALLHGLSALPRRDEALRRELTEQARAHGRARLHGELAHVDPQAARLIPANNLQRVVRALEVYRLSGRPISDSWTGKEKKAPAGIAVLSIQWPAEELARRIAARAASLWPGVLEEARRLAERYSGEEPGFQSLGYREALRCLRGEISPADGLREMTAATLAYAKRQRTWFRHQIEAAEIPGGEVKDMLDQALKRIHEAGIP